MIKSISFITGNTGKYGDAVELFTNSGIEIKQLSMETPEIQSENPTEISLYSAEFVSKTLNEPFFVMDRSFSIAELNGFPGPFIKYINKWLNEEDFVKLLSDCKNTDASWFTSISCYIPNKGIKTFLGESKGRITLEALGKNGYMVDKIFIPDVSDKTLAQMDTQEERDFWNSCSCWRELLQYLKEN